MTREKIQDLSEKVVATFMELLKEHEWDEVSLSLVAEKAEISLSELRDTFDGKVAIYKAFCRQIDKQVLDELDNEISEELPRERLMDVLLSRFDALMTYRDAIRHIVKARRQDLTLAAQLHHVSLVSMTWMVNAAGIGTEGVKGALKIKGAEIVFEKSLAVFLDDDEGMTKTMAKIDKELRAGERNLKRLDRASKLLSPLKRFKTRMKAKPVQENYEEQASS